MSPRQVLAPLLGLLFITVSAAAADHPHPRLADDEAKAVNAVVEGFVTAGAFPFLYVRVEDREGHVVYEHGARNPELMPARVDGDDWLRIWSMSKIVTIATVLDLVEDGVLSLDDPVSRYVPEVAGMKVAVAPDGTDLSRADEAARAKACPYRLEAQRAPMTVRHLLNHQAGFYYPLTGMDCLDAPLGAADLPAARDGDEFLARLATLPLINQPGANYYYGTGTTMLGLLAERATGQSLKELVEARVTGPLGIEGLRYGLPEGESLPPRFSGADGQLRHANTNELDIFGSSLPDYDPARMLFLGGEGMVATPDGYADFARMLLRRGELDGYRLLEEKTIDELIAPHTLTDSPWGHNGYNLWIANGQLPGGERGPAPLWIGGGYEGTHFWIDPERELVGIVVTQIFQAPPQGAGRNERIRMAFYEALGWRPDVAAEDGGT